MTFVIIEQYPAVTTTVIEIRLPPPTGFQAEQWALFEKLKALKAVPR